MANGVDLTKPPPWWGKLTPDQRNHLTGLNARSAYCKGTRRHMYRPLIPGEPIPKSVDIRAVQGVVQVTEHCITCRRWVRRIASRAGYRDRTVGPVYGGGQDGYLASGLDMPGWAYGAWLDWLSAEQIADAAKLSAKREAEAKAEPATKRAKAG